MKEIIAVTIGWQTLPFILQQIQSHIFIAYRFSSLYNDVQFVMPVFSDNHPITYFILIYEMCVNKNI